jgi:uncharacterized protein (UPF0212 family)
MSKTYVVTVTYSIDVYDCENEEEAIAVVEHEIEQGVADFEFDAEEVDEENEDDNTNT